MRGVTKRHVGTSGELRLASEWSHGRVALTCSTSGELPFNEFYISTTSDRSLLSKIRPWKNQVLYAVQMRVLNPTVRTDKQRDFGEVLFSLSEDINLM